MLDLKKNPPQGRVEKIDKEPFFGSGAPSALAYAASLMVVFLLLSWLRH